MTLDLTAARRKQKTEMLTTTVHHAELSAKRKGLTAETEAESCRRELVAKQIAQYAKALAEVEGMTDTDIYTIYSGLTAEQASIVHDNNPDYFA